MRKRGNTKSGVANQGHAAWVCITRPKYCEPAMLGIALEQVPERLVVDGVVELNFGAFDYGPKLARRAVGGGLLQVGVTALHVVAKNLANPLGFLEVFDGLLDVVGQEASAGAEVAGLGDLAVDAGLEDAVQREIGVGVRSHGTNFSAHGAMVADWHADHRATVRGGGADLVGGRAGQRLKNLDLHTGVGDMVFA